MGVHDCLLPRAAVCTDPLLARDWLDREDRRFDEIPAALDPAAEFRKRELADVLLRMKPEFQEFPLQYGEIAAFEKISPDEARRKYRQIEINGPGLQFTFCDQHVTIGVYSTVDTDELQAILAVLSAEGGFVLFDPQQNDFVDLQEYPLPQRQGASQPMDTDSFGFLCGVILVGVITTACTEPLPAETDPPPNIVFIFADDLGVGDLGCYGHPYAKTPAIDQLASEGTRFTQSYVTGVTCCPSRTGFMTGLFPARFQRYPADYGFGDRITITDLFKENGYRTGHFGKWHMGPKTDGQYGIDVYRSGENTKGTSRGRDAGLFDEAIEFIRDSAEGPFYVNVWGHATHYPVDTHPDLVAEFANVVVDRDDFSPAMQHKFDECEQLGGDLNACMRQYLGDVYSIDLNVQRLLAVIDELGLRENTIVVFSSDHGPAPVLLGAKQESKEFSANMLGYAGEFRGGKHEQYEGGVRVPFIIRWPGHIRAGRVNEQSVISGIDWIPTLCRLAGIEDLPQQLDGEDVSDIWLGSSRNREKPLFWKTSAPGSGPAMRDGKWKLHINPRRGEPVELYNLATDPSESQNLAQQHRQVVAQLQAKLNAWVAELPKAYDKSDNGKERKTREKRSRRRNRTQQ